MRGEDGRYVNVGSRSEVDGIVLSPDGPACTALGLPNILRLDMAEAGEQVEGCQGEPVLLPLCLDDGRAERAAALEDIQEVSLCLVEHVRLVSAARLLDVARQRLSADDGGLTGGHQQRPDQADPLPLARLPDSPSGGR